MNSSNISSFRALCGDPTDPKPLRSIHLTTTMWDDVDEADGSRRETELKKHHLVKRGSVLKRFLGTTDSAWDLINDLIQVSNRQFDAMLEYDMSDLRAALGSKHRGLFADFKQLIDQQRDLIRKIRVEANQNVQLPP